MKISIIGLGKLGSPMAACMASHGHEVIGVDINPRFVDAINRGTPPVFEPGLGELLEAACGNLSATNDFGFAIHNSDISFIIVPTPSRDDGFFTVEYAVQAARSIGTALRQKEKRHIVVLTSTVMPGDTRTHLIPALEESSRKRCPEDIGVCYSPEFISLGSVIRDYLRPDFVLIGESDIESGDVLEGVYESVCENAPPVARMSFVNAELAKLALNAFVTTKISYANMLAELCEQFEDGNVDDVTNALGLDSRIGRKYLKGSIGYGGPCFPRDSIALAMLAKRFRIDARLPEATHSVNQRQVSRLQGLVYSCLPPNGRVGVLGLAYKPHTDVVERSQGLELVQAIADGGTPVFAYDPHANGNARKVVGTAEGHVRFTDSAVDCVRSSDVVVLCSPCAEFQQLSGADFVREGARRTVIDCWRVLDRPEITSITDYVGIGTGAVLRSRAAIAGTVAKRDVKQAA